MHYKTNRVNHDFQIAYFIAGSCHTPDGAYAILQDLREDRDNALKMYLASVPKEKARMLRAEQKLKSGDEADQLEGQAEIAEIRAMAQTTKRNVEAAQAELATIDKLIAIVQPMRKYGHLPDPQAHQAAQHEEWKLELIQRAENFIITTGTIPSDHFATMRLHPAFQSDILPALSDVKALMLSGDVVGLRALQSRAKPLDLPGIVAALPDYVSNSTTVLPAPEAG